MSVKINRKPLKREISKCDIHVASTITIFVIMALVLFILSTFIIDRYKTIVIPKDLYFPRFTVVTKTRHSSIYVFHRYPSSLTRGVEFSDSNGLVDIWHSMSDDEIIEKAKRVPHVAEDPRKIAFMFLTRRSLPLRSFWEKFFEGHDGLFSIYLHTSPDFNYEPPNSSVFYKRRIPSKIVQWGKPSMIDAERRLIANALLDFTNQRFILLSESCIPIFNFTTIYNFLMNANESFLSSFDDPRKIGRGRYNKQMSPTITLKDWRKGSQWFEVNRELAHEIVFDKTYYNVFHSHCLPPCYMDEHYLPTLVNKIRPDLTTNATVTWTDWSGGGSHPTTFTKKDITKTFINKIKYGSNCSYNGVNSKICFLFARKFHPSTLEPLLKMAPTVFG
ncbi:hypothetical protein LXL04_011285 [Taraxacum kok-saghyz]